MNILLNINNFSEPFAYDVLKDILCSDMKVLIIPWSYKDEWIHNAIQFKRHYMPGKPEYEDIAKEFDVYGISRDHIRVLNFYFDSKEKCEYMIQHADILFFTGGYPDCLLYRIDKKGIRNSIQSFNGIVMGTSAGAMIQFDHYHLTPEEDGKEYDYHHGLGLLSGFDIEVHYEENYLHLSSLIIDLKLHGKPIIALPNTGGMVIDEENYALLGDAFEISVDDLDVLQDTLDRIIEESEH